MIELAAQIDVWTVWRRSVRIGALRIGTFACATFCAVFLLYLASLFFCSVRVLPLSDGFEKYLPKAEGKPVVFRKDNTPAALVSASKEAV